MSATIVSSGQNGSGIVLYSGDQLIVLPGGTASGAVNSGGTVISTGAVVVSGATLAASAGGILVTPVAVLSGGSVSSGGRQIVLPAGLATGTRIGAGGRETVTSGGASTGTMVGSGAQVEVLSGGLSLSATVVTGGSLTVTSGGRASATVMSGGAATVAGSGAVALDLVGRAAASIFVQAGGVLARPSTDSSVTLLVQGGGTVSGGSIANAIVQSGGTILQGLASGRVTVLSGGTYVSGAVTGTLDVQSGGVAISARASQPSGGAATLGGMINVLSGGVASGLLVEQYYRFGYGVATVYAGGAAYDTVTQGYTIVDGGTSYRTRVIGDAMFGIGSETVKNGGRTFGTTGLQIVSSGGWTSGTIGHQFVLSGGVSVDTEVQSENTMQSIGPGGIASGAIVFPKSTQYISAFGTASGTVLRGTAVVEAGGKAIGTVVSSGGLLSVAAGAAISSTMLAPGGRVLLTGVPTLPDGTADYNAADNTLTIREGVYTKVLTFAGDYTNEYFHLADNGAGSAIVTVDGTPCFCHGTLILTERGEIHVEQLAIGDMVVTASGGCRPIRWLGKRSYAPRFVLGNADVLPVLIRAGALGGGLPRRDLRVSPLHAMAIEGVLVPAGALVNGLSILQPARPEAIDYVHIELDAHDLVLAEGAWSETFIDDDSRAMFHNAAEYRTLYPHALSPPPRYCLPRVEHGARLAAIRRGLTAA